MSWWAIDVRAPADRRDVMGAWLVAHTGQAVEEREDGTLVAFAPDEQAAHARAFGYVKQIGREALAKEIQKKNQRAGLEP